MKCPDCEDRGYILGHVPHHNPVTEITTSRCIGWVRCTNPIHMNYEELLKRYSERELKRKGQRK